MQKKYEEFEVLRTIRCRVRLRALDKVESRAPLQHLRLGCKPLTRKAFQSLLPEMVRSRQESAASFLQAQKYVHVSSDGFARSYQNWVAP